MENQRTPLKVVVALANAGFIALALALPEHPWLSLFAAAVWAVHGLMALAALVIAPSRGEPRHRALQVLMVGTFSFLQLIRLPKGSDGAQGPALP